MSIPKTSRSCAALALGSVAVVALAALALAACGGSSTTAASSSPTSAASQSTGAGLVAASELPTPAPTPTVAGTILFDSDFTSSGHADTNLSVVNTDGSGLQRVINIESPVCAAGWSPDGRWIAYTLAYKDIWTVAVARADGSDAHRLPLGRLSGLDPSWSPDGKRLAYYSWWWPRDEYPPPHIFVCDADGSHRRQLTKGLKYDMYPEWTPDGQAILFLRKEHQYLPGDVYSVRPDGSGLTRVTSTGFIWEFALSPDGSQLAVHDLSDAIMLLPYGTSGAPKTILGTDFGWGMVHISWSPDGKALVLGCSDDTTREDDVFVIVNADGSGLSAIPGVKGGQPEWRPE